MDRVRRFLRLRLSLVAVVSAVVVALVSSAIATPVSGVTSNITHARGTVPGHFKLQLQKSSNAGDVAVSRIIIAPGGHFGWHSHPGPVLVVVKAGALTTYEADDKTCTGTTYPAGSVCIDDGYGDNHIARNEGSTPLEVWATFLDVPPGQSPRIDGPDPGNCPF